VIYFQNSRLAYNSVKIQTTKPKDKYNLVRQSVDHRRPNPDAAMIKKFFKSSAPYAVFTGELHNDIGNSFKAFIYLLLVTLGKNY
jgi:hypothetical protein